MSPSALGSQDHPAVPRGGGKKEEKDEAAYRAPDAYLPRTSPAPIEWIPSRSADGPLAQTPLGRWPQAEAGTEQRRAKENDVT